MTQEKELTCVRCPNGCALTYKSGKVEGAGCKLGVEWSLEEVKTPMRTLQTTVKTDNPLYPRLPVRTSSMIRLEEVKKVAEAAQCIVATGRVKRGDVIEKNIAGTGADLVASSNILSEAYHG